MLETVDEIAIVAAPGYADAASYDALLSHCERLKDRVAILDPPADVTNVDLLTRVATVTARKPPKEGAAAEPADAAGGLRPRNSVGYGAFYFPRILVRDPFSSQRDPVTVAASGHMAGIWARTDATRGVHKAPANEPVHRGALGVELPPDAQRAGVAQPGRGQLHPLLPDRGHPRLGRATLADAASEWRYLNVRRLFNMVEESIAESTRWMRLRAQRPAALEERSAATSSAFLTRVWRDGALHGRTPEEAFFVKCDEETNPPESIDAGMVVTLIGIAPVKPAEFIVFRIGQHAGGSPDREPREGPMPEAAAGAQPGTFVDPYRAYNFKLQIQGVTEGHFTECSGMGVKVNPIRYREGGQAQVVHRLPGRVDYSAITLRYGLTASRELWNWFLTAVEGQVERKNVSIVLMDSQGASR